MKGYDPEKGSQQDKDEHPEKYRLQGIYAGLVDDLAESLIEREPPQGDPRLISYGEFKKKYFEPSVNEMFSNIAKTLKMMSNEERQSFDWRRPEDESN